MEKKTLRVAWKIFLVTFLCLLSFTVISESQERKVVVCSWGGDYEKAFRKTMVEPFEKETGIKVIVTSYPDFGKMKAMVDSGNVEWDVVDIPGRHLYRGVKAGLFEPLDFTIIDKSDILPEMVHPYGVGIEYYILCIAYRTKKFTAENHPKSWADFWDVKRFPGSRGLRGTAEHTMEIALLADGVPKEKIYPIDVNRAFKSLDRIKPHISVWWTKNAIPPQLLTDGEVDLTSAHSGRIIEIRKGGVPVDLELNQGLLGSEWLVVLKGSKNKKEAMQLIAYCSRAEPQAEFNQVMSYVPINKKSWKYIDPKYMPNIPKLPDDRFLIVNDEWWGEHEGRLTEMFKTWMLK